MKPGVIALLWMLVACLLSCGPSRDTHSPDPVENNAGDASRILFLNYQISRDSSSGNFEAQLVSKLFRDGKIKDNMQGNSPSKQGDLELQILDRNQQPMTSLIIPNPLDRIVEYVNDARQLGSKMIHLDSAQFNVRVQIEPDAASILLYRITGENQEEQLLLQTSIL